MLLCGHSLWAPVKGWRLEGRQRHRGTDRIVWLWMRAGGTAAHARVESSYCTPTGTVFPSRLNSHRRPTEPTPETPGELAQGVKETVSLGPIGPTTKAILPRLRNSPVLPSAQKQTQREAKIRRQRNMPQIKELQKSRKRTK